VHASVILILDALRIMHTSAIRVLDALRSLIRPIAMALPLEKYCQRKYSRRAADHFLLERPLALAGMAWGRNQEGSPVAST
jgi:hypothetical protein